jgi:hypothetical protein
MHGCEDEEEERSENVHKSVLLYSSNFAYKKGSSDSTGLDVPASAGLICNVFAKYKKTFGMP